MNADKHFERYLKKHPPKTWRDDDVTEKQIQAIINMSEVLGRSVVYPKTKGEASDIIQQLIGWMKMHDWPEDVWQEYEYGGYPDW